MKAIKEFIKMESFSGIILLTFTVLAFVCANSPCQNLYHHFINFNFSLSQSPYFYFPATPLEWVNDGFMALFFCLIGLEVKREILYGELSTLKKSSLPLIAAIGGIIVPALIYLGFHFKSPTTVNGWAIPTATDIAFSLSILNFFAARVPLSLKTFLLAFAIFDDLAAIIIIAIFYRHSGNLWFLALSLIPIIYLFLLRLLKITNLYLYALGGFILWLLVLNSGIHATMAGVLFALFIPTSNNENKHHSLLHILEKKLHPYVAYLILPSFAFVNSGTTLGSTFIENLSDPLPISIFCALFFGKQFGIFFFSWLFIKLNWLALPDNCTIRHLYGVSILGGIGFTMSLFIGFLSFNKAPAEYINMVKIGVILGSLSSALFGSVVLYFTHKRNNQK